LSFTHALFSNTDYMIIGIDDTDSRKGMCTTYLCAVLVDELREYGDVSTPRLVRLNPCIPFKTRGNGAISFEVVCAGKEEEVKEVVRTRVCELSELNEEGTNPGVVFGCVLDIISYAEEETLKHFYERAVREVLTLEDTYSTLADLQFDYFGLKNRRGLIGALAAVSFFVLQRNQPNYYDFTYELIEYRKKQNRGKARVIDEASVWKADAATYPLTWDTVDVANNKIVFAPHSPCPVLFGIRGDSADAIYRADKLIHAEPEERKMLFITNQGTDSHLIPLYAATKAKLHEFHSYSLVGEVCSNPKTIEGGHVVFPISLSDSGTIECIAYEPTKGFRNLIRKLRVGDEITAFGSQKKGTINLEKIEIRKLNVVEERNPRCGKCGRSMDSAGRLQGYRCKRCGTHRAHKEVVTIKRQIEEGFYETPPVARRHLSKPLVRVTAKRIHPSR